MAIITYELITSEHRERPKFMSTVNAGVDIINQVANELEKFIQEFDIDTAAGEQLDILGQWLDSPRVVDLPLSGLYGVELPDSEYRTLLKAKITANNWNGTIDNAYDVWETMFSGSIIVIKDFQDMSIEIWITGSLTLLEQALLLNGYIALKPSGVRIDDIKTIPTPGVIFGWDLQTQDVFDGWDTGQWAESLTP